MKKKYFKSKFRNDFFRKIFFLCLPVIFSLTVMTGYSQTIYADAVLSEVNVQNSAHSTDANPATYSELESGSGIIIGIGSYSSHIELSFPALVPANQTSFVRIETEDNILSSLIGGTLGNLLSGITGVALVGNQEFSVQVKNGASVVLSGNSTNPSSFSGERLKVVIDENGHTYLAITPNQDYRSIRITNFVGSLVGLGMKKHMKIWDPYYVVQGAHCDKPMFTSYDSQGISLELLNLGGGVSNLERVIDGSLPSHSTLSLGVVSVTSSITQRVYFEGVSTPTDIFAVHLGIDHALLAITLGQGIRIRSQNGATVATNQTLQSLLTPADVAAIQSGQPVTVYIAPGVPVDRIILDLNGILGITVSQSLRIHEVYKIAPPPILDVTASDLTICEGATANLVAHAINPLHEIRWYSTALAATPITITASGAVFTTGALHSDTTFYVASGVVGCPEESVRIPVNVDVIPGPDPSSITVPVFPEYCAVDTVIIQANSILGNNFEWYLTPQGTTPIVSGQQNGTHTYVIQNDSMIITGLSVADSPFTIYVAVQDTNTGCWSTPGNYVPVTIVIIDELPPTATFTEQSFCANASATVADIQINGTTINWYDAPVGGNLLLPTEQLQDSVSYYASAVGVRCESSQRLEVLVRINDEPVPTTTDPQQHFCVADNATIDNLIVNGTNINWYDENGNPLPNTTLLVNGGVYLATDQGLECESSDSLMITVSISDLPAPTAGDTIQLFCEIDAPTIEDIALNETTVVWYDENGNSVVPGTLLTDSTNYYAALVSPNCESSIQLEIFVMFERVAPPTAQDTVQSFCQSSSGLTVADITVNEPAVIWYDAATGGNVVAPSTPLVDGETYHAAQQGSNCESENRLAITVTIHDLPAPTTGNTVQSFCVSSAPPTVADLQVNETNVIWYDENGNQLSPTTLLADGGVYLATTHGFGCESSDSLTITVSVTDLPAPTASDTIQLFCEANSPTIEDIVLNETTIAWYDENGMSIPPGTSLTDSTSYYASMVGTNCESSTQLEIFVVFERIAPPTAQETTQVFCQSSSGLTVADIVINEPGIVWYDALVGGNMIPSSTLLVNGQTYYAAQLGTNCESEDRLAITVTIHDLPAPTTNNAVQNFCISSTPPTVSDLQANETNVIWYNSNGTMLNASSVLVNGETYYGVLHQGNCQSSDSLVVSVIIESQSLTSLNGAFNNVCFSDTLTYSVASGMSNYSWIVTGGSVISGGSSSDNTIVIVWQHGTANSMQVSYETSSGCLVQTDQAITIQTTVCSDLTIHKTVDNLNPFIGEQITFTITVSNAGNDSFSDIVVDEVIQSGFTYVGYQSENSTYDPTTGKWTIPYLGANETATLTITVVVNPTGNYSNVATIISGDDSNPTNNTSDVVVEPHCLTVYNEISPNGDGVNDYFHVDCIEQFPGNSVIIYNRYGNVVYSADGYQNDWDGVANVTGVIGKGEPLPTGTYYYLLKIEEKDFESSGWIYIVR